jgi:hypothetical protein
MTVLWKKFLEVFFSRIWFPKFKRETDRIAEDLLELGMDEASPDKTKAPTGKGQGLTY